MELIAAYLACILLGLTGLRLGIPEAYHTLADRRHEACLRRTVVLELELGMRDAPQLSPVQSAVELKAGNYSHGLRAWLPIIYSPEARIQTPKPRTPARPTPTKRAKPFVSREPWPGESDDLPYPYCGIDS